jgi:hypothetical protein
MVGALQEMDCPLYATLEDVLHNCMPAVIIPKKWANVTYLLHILYIGDKLYTWKRILKLTLSCL